ncbi:hypothetical protein Pmar_PMAR016118 [Perkinsus marinus ATCC 50983]|uniref:Chromo domain-containing protein n=1 Tax=Perkinsus marinus (strain ATCC 50983 / TXsc) TaxID=423536 RepID=C5LZ31_PERM5|nr:hypothetical protein Pmar_PMAR016118 [Perkinsus marinus ATCC 50983]EEQ98040.1 hypothetical protein Pmar_PMAR016118 [Perkinsus marinus ATCC 50983]|eukprot:XP_002765323.1 hypothetical protein Pmar_PMAR016118 [Perkinsus marinus ATCC 50983]
MVLTDSLGTTVVKTLHQLGIVPEYLQLEEAFRLSSDVPIDNRAGGSRMQNGLGTIPWIRRIYGQCALTAGTPSGLLQLRQILYEEKARLPTPNNPRQHIPIVHLSMHALEMVVAGKKATRCILEDGIGKAHLVEADELGKLLGLDNNNMLVFINACKSESVGEVFASHFGVKHVVCIGHEAAILDVAATLFTQEFYAALLCPTVTIQHAFNRARHAVKFSANPKIASQYTLFHLLPEGGDHDVPVWATSASDNKSLSTMGNAMRYYPSSMLSSENDLTRGNQGYSFDRNLRPVAVRCIPAEAADSDDDDEGDTPTQTPFQLTEKPSVPLGSSNLGIEGSPLENAAPVEDFLGPSGSGKRTLVTQTAMYYSLPGGRFFSGGACVVLLPRLWPMENTNLPKLYVQGDGAGGENDSLTASEVADRFIRVVMKEIRTTIRLLKEWYPPQTRSTMPDEYEEDEEELFADDEEGLSSTSHGPTLTGKRSPAVGGGGGGSLSDNDMTISHSSGSLTPLERTSVNRSISSAHYAEKESIEELEMELFGVATRSGMGAAGGLGTRGYKVFLSEQFADASALEQFLKGYNVPPIPVSRLLKELRENGTQLQDWGTGRLVRVVHVVRCMISVADEMEQREEIEDVEGEHKKARCLVERRITDGKLKLLSKKFDPVTENVLEVCSEAVKKEIAHSVSDVSVRKVVMRNRKPLVELERSSPTYEGLATKYVLYTTEVLLDGLPSGVEEFETTEAPVSGGNANSSDWALENGHKSSPRVHHWEWLDRDCAEDLFLREGHGEAAAAGEQKSLFGAPSAPQQSLELELASGVARQVRGEHAKGTAMSKVEAATKRLQRTRHEWARAMREWANVTDTMNSARSPSSSVLVLLRAECYMPIPEIRQLLGQALSKHRNLKTMSVAYKVVCFRLPPLQPLDAAMLFARRVHRPIYEADIRITTTTMLEEFDAAGGERTGTDTRVLCLNDSQSEGLGNLARLAKHPVLVAALVGPQTPTILHIMPAVRELLGFGGNKEHGEESTEMRKAGGTPGKKTVEELPQLSGRPDRIKGDMDVTMTPEGLSDVRESRVGICYDFARNQWVARYGVTIETFPLNPGPLDSKMPKFEAAFRMATQWFDKQCEMHRSRAVLLDGEGTKERGSLERRPNSIAGEHQPKKKAKAGVEKEQPRRENRLETAVEGPGEESPLVLDSVTNVHDYRNDGVDEEYLVTGKSRGQLHKKVWIKISQCSAKKDEDMLRAFRDKRLGDDDDGSDSESVYELECIEGYKKSGKKEEFYVKWRGYSSAENTWEPLRNLTGVSTEEIEEARQKFGGKKATAKRGTKKSGKDAHLSDSNSREVTEMWGASGERRGRAREMARSPRSLVCLVRAAIASNTACECISSCGAGLLSAAKAWCYVDSKGCGVGTCSCFGASEKLYDYCDDSLGIIRKEREKTRREVEDLRSKLDELRSRLNLDDSTELAQKAVLEEKEVQREELETVISSQKGVVGVVSWYSLWCAVAVTILFSFLALSFCLYKAFLLRKRVQSGVSTSPVTEALLGPNPF